MTDLWHNLQVVMNFQRKSTVGFSIGYILLDLLGGVTNYGQMAVQSIDQSMPSIPQFDTCVCVCVFI